MLRNVLKSLLKPDAYPEPTSCVELVQTHVSFIFLTDRYAYKIKKPVDFGFLNFSSIDRRRFYCNEEVRLNRRLCPDTYEGVVEVRESANGAAFHGNGQIIDYAVKMTRLPADRMLDKLVEQGHVTATDMRLISKTIADFHQTAATSPQISEYGRIDRIMFNWQENFDQTLAFEESTLPNQDRELIRAWVSSFAHDNREVFDQRHASGFIRECDGDIHLENICLQDGTALIFDCIEFNERFRCCDTAADIAFLLMDLDFHNRHDLADDVISEYIAASQDFDVIKLIVFYKIYRAFVRGKVESFRMKDTGIDPAERDGAGIRAGQYFRLACGYIMRLALRQTVFITCGLMGSGKSTLAQQLGFELGITPVISDIVRKQLAGIAADEQSIVDFETGLYSREMSDETYSRLLQMASDEVSHGRSVIIDACCVQKHQRQRFSALALSSGVQLVILLLSCSEAENKRRLTAREAAGSSNSDGRLELLGQQAALFEPPDDTEGRIISISAALSPSAMTREIYRGLELTC